MTRATLQTLLEHSAAERLGWTLLHFLWQGAAVAALLVVAMWVLRRRTPQARYLACCAALAAMAVLPCATFLWLGAAGTHSAVSGRAARTNGAVYLGPVAGSERDMSDGHSPAGSVAEEATAAPIASCVACAWAAGVAGLAFWHVGGWVHLRRRLRRETLPVGGPLRDELRELSAALRVSRPVRLVEAAWVQVPSVVGVLRPVLVFPAAALTGLSPGQLRALLAHELAHVCRHDYAVNLLQTVVQTLLFYHPAVWWVSARMREEREYCCDDVAAAASGDRVTYARALAAMEELRALPVGLALAARGGSLLRRVQRLLGVAPAPVTTRGRNRSLLAAALAVACAALPLAAPRVDAGPATTRPASPETRPASVDDVPETPVTEEDLIADKSEYTLSPNDLVSIEITGLEAPDKVSVKSTRIRQDGKVGLPYIGQLKLGGLTELDAEKLIADTYKKQRVLEQAPVSVTVVEARGRSFSIIGAAGRPGQYSIAQPDFRLLDAMAVAAVDPKVEGMFVLRKVPEKDRKPGEPPPQPRKIRVPMDKLAAGDLSANLVVRPGDLIVVTAAQARTARLVIGPDGVTLDGKALSWEDLPAALEKIPQAERRRTTLQLSPATPDLTLRQYSEARTRAAALAKRHGFAGTVDDVFDAAGARDGAAAPAGAARPDESKPVYFLGGHVERGGAYALGQEEITLRQAILSAGVEGRIDELSEVYLIRLKAGQPAEEVRLGAPELLIDGKGDQPLRPGDRIMVLRTKKG